MIEEPTLSVFVDESGRFQHPDKESPYYIISLVMHDQRVQIDGLIAELDRHFAEMRLSNVCFHAGPIIRQQNAFAIMDWTFRVKIFRFQKLRISSAAPATVLRLPSREIYRPASRQFHPPLSRTRKLYQNRRARIKRGGLSCFPNVRNCNRQPANGLTAVIPQYI